MVLLMDREAVVGVEGVEQGTQHTVLVRASAEAQGRGCVVAYSDPLSAIRQEAVDPHAGGMWKAQVPQFDH